MWRGSGTPVGEGIRPCIVTCIPVTGIPEPWTPATCIPEPGMPEACILEPGEGLGKGEGVLGLCWGVDWRDGKPPGAGNIVSGNPGGPIGPCCQPPDSGLAMLKTNYLNEISCVHQNFIQNLTNKM